MKPSDIDDELLNRYVDGELDRATRLQINALISEDPTLAQRVNRLRDVDVLLKEALRWELDAAPPKADPNAMSPTPTLHAVPLADLSTTKTHAPQVRPTYRRLPVNLAAIAATLVLGIVIGRAVPVTPPPVAPSVIAQYESTLMNALETAASGTTVDWRDESGDASAQAVPLRTWRAVSGHYCREFQAQRFDNGIEIVEVGIACRLEGRWLRQQSRFEHNAASQQL